MRTKTNVGNAYASSISRCFSRDGIHWTKAGMLSGSEATMLKLFLVFYTASGGIAAISDMRNDTELCEQIAQDRNEHNLKYVKTDIYVAECEKHTKRPKVQVRIDPKERRYLESYCRNVLGNVGTCNDLPNGDVELLGYRGTHKHIYIVNKKNLLKNKYYGDQP